MSNLQIITDASDIKQGPTYFTCWDYSFDFKFYLIETSENYASPLTVQDVESIYQDITNHHNSDYGHFDHIKYALCTNSNEYAPGLNKDGDDEFFILTFTNSDAVLFLESK
jgi:hypothetical protein